MTSKKMFLIRHAHASITSGKRDFERVLSDAGRFDAGKTGDYLKKKDLVPDAFLSSTATRARQTSEIIAKKILYPISDIQVFEDLYESSVRSMIGLVNSFDQSWTNVVVVGHNPVLSDFIDYACGNTGHNMETGSVAELNVFVENWSEFSGSVSELVDYWMPVNML